VRKGVVAHGLDHDRGVESVGGDREQQERLACVGVVALEDARHLVSAARVDEALFCERAASGGGVVRASASRSQPVGARRDVEDGFAHLRRLAVTARLTKVREGA
jgi:hypothetical protein